MIKKYEEITEELNKTGKMYDLMIYFHLHLEDNFIELSDEEKEKC